MHLYLHENAAQIILLLFLTITFLQSGIDKLKDWGGNLSWLKEHFSQTVFKNSVPLLLGVITLIELVAGVLSLIGVVHISIYDTKIFAFYGALISCLALLLLFMGQRIAKDYEGAKTIAIYLVAASFLLYLLQ